MGSLKSENDSKQDLNDSGCVQDASVSENSYKGLAHFLDLSDDVLLYVLKFCTPRDLKALGHTCPRLGTLVCDRTLWTHVDARSTPVGQERLRWLLTHCLSTTTTELKLTGYANKHSRCLGIQDLNWPAEAESGFLRGTRIGTSPGVEVEHFLLRMWYPHLPRFAVSPRWPDKEETDKKAPQKVREAAMRMKALKESAETQASNSGTTPSSTDKPGNSETNLANSSTAGSNSSTIGCNSSVVGSNSTAACSNSSTTGSNSSTADTNSGAASSDSSIASSNSSASSSNSSTAVSNSSAAGSNSSTLCFKCCPDSSDILKQSVDFKELNDDVKDCKGPQFTLTGHLLRDLRNKCSELTSLALEYCNIDYKSTNIRQFPPKLKKLSLRGTRCYNLPLHTSYLCKIQDRLPELEYLDVSECDWFEPASLMPLSKVPHLKELRMRECKRLSECVAYASLATRYGFRELRVVDVRGSPVADSEVSAFGWLPLLEELYCASSEDFKNTSEHTHSWNDTLPTFQELEQWEMQEPDYYKTKSPDLGEPMEEDELKDEPESNEKSERFSEVLLGNPWWTHERRIIVIQPNANRQLEDGPADQRADPQEDLPNGGPVDPPQAEPGPSKRPAAENVLDLVKRPRLSNEKPPEEAPVQDPVHHQHPQEIPRLNNRSLVGFSLRRRGGISNRPQVMIHHRNELAIDMPERVAPNNRPQAGVIEGPQVYINNRPLINERPANDAGPSRNNQVNRARLIQLQNDIMNLDHEERQSNHINLHTGYHLVTDSAILRFGRAENDNVNYIQIGRNGLQMGSEQGMRPNRSNLRILSVTGYRNITDRSLVHLSTAAPHLRLIDFSETSVTQHGVEVFKAIRPNCEVIFSEFSRNK